MQIEKAVVWAVIRICQALKIDDDLVAEIAYVAIAGTGFIIELAILAGIAALAGTLAPSAVFLLSHMIISRGAREHKEEIVDCALLTVAIFLIFTAALKTEFIPAIALMGAGISAYLRTDCPVT